MTMTVAPPPETRQIDDREAPPISTPTKPAKPPQILTPAEPWLGAPGATPVGRRASGRIVGGLILIALGLVFLGANILATPGALLFVGLGTAFLVARITTGQYGFSVPAGILLAFGTFVGLTEYGVLVAPSSGGYFFVLLGVGFLAVYVIGARPTMVWPIVPSLALGGFGVFVQTVTFGWPPAGFVGLAQYWPLAVVALGVWLLLRDYLTPAARLPVAVIGASILILVGVLVAAAGVASTVTGSAVRDLPWVPLSGIRPLTVFGSPPLQDTVTLSAPLGSAQSINVVNTSGRTLVRTGRRSDVTVTATRHFWAVDAAPDVRLVPQGSSLTIDSNERAFDVRPTYVDYVIDVPVAAGTSVRSTSGAVELVGISGAIAVQTTSGSVRLDNLAGDVRISTTSGDVRVRFIGEPSAQIDAGTMSGTIRTTALGWAGERRDGRSVTGTLGSGSARLEVRTTSGDITLSR